MPNNNFHPNIGGLLTLDFLPDSLGFETSVLDKIFYKNLRIFRSKYGEKTSFSIEIISSNLKFDLFNSGMELELNPDDIGVLSAIPLEFFFHFEVLKYLNQFKASEFGFSISDFFKLTLSLVGVSEEDLLLNGIDLFVVDPDPIQKFIIDYNNSQGNLLTLTPTSDFQTLVNEIEANNISIISIVQNFFIEEVSDPYENLRKLFYKWIGLFSTQSLKRVITPKFSGELKSIDLALSFPRRWLQPVNPVTLEVISEVEIKSKLSYSVGKMFFSSETGFEFEQIDSFDFTPSQIGNTGLILEVDELKFDFRSDRNIPEATADGRPDSFKGIYANKLGVTLPKKWFNNVDGSTLKISGRNMLIGSGGISGILALEAVGGGIPGETDFLDFMMGNWMLGFKNFDILFKQNVISQSNITGYIKIPKLKDTGGNDAQIDFKGHLYEDGDFSLTASEEDGIPLNLFDFVTIIFKTIELGREDDTFYLETSCDVKFENDIMTNIFGDQKIVLPKLRIYDDGSMEIVGGNAFIPTNITLNLGPVEVAVTGIHFGSHQQEYNGNMRTYNYWGFDGAISIDPLGIDARGEGLKYYYTVDNDEFADSDSFIRIQTIEVDLIIPGTASPSTAAAIIHGMVSIPEPDESPEYIGEISLKLPKAKIAGGAAMKLQPKHPAFIIDAYIDLPAPIPIGPLGIYGFRGLFGYRYVAEKEAIGLVSGEDTWYDYYTADPKGIHVEKFSGPESSSEYSFPFSIGAGAVLGTGFDDGTVLSIRAMLLLSIRPKICINMPFFTQKRVAMPNVMNVKKL